MSYVSKKNKLSFSVNFFTMKKPVLFIILSSLSLISVGQRALKPSDIYKVKYVDDPEVSPDGKWVAYVVSTPDSIEDKYDDNIWMAATDGSGLCAGVQLGVKRVNFTLTTAFSKIDSKYLLL